MPFALFMVLLALRGAVPDEGLAGIDGRWIYAGQAVLVAAALAWAWPRLDELRGPGSRPTASQVAIAVATGLLVYALWIVLDQPWMMLGEPSASFVPIDATGNLQWGLIAFRLFGAAAVVPLMEEVFWRGFLMRWIQDSRAFQNVDPRTVRGFAIAASTGCFMLAHTQWLAAIVAGLAYALLYVRTGKLWTAVIAHAVTNLVLGVWVIHGRHWAFW